MFISTHNFEFFSVLIDCKLFKYKSSTSTENLPFYLINRTLDNGSTLRNLPRELRSHKSEYAFLFHILKEYEESPTKETNQYKILLPNALRRFLELYTLFKFPKGYSSIDERMKKIFSPEDEIFHNTKLYHWFSHQQQLEKVAHHDEKIFLIDDAISEVMNYIKEKDKLHWSGLTENI